MTKRRLLIGIFLLGILMPSSGLCEIADRIIAIVNDEIITLSELNSTFEPYQKRIDATYKGSDRDKVIADSRVMVLNRIIDNKLIEQLSRKSGIVVKDDEVMDNVKDLLRRKNITMEEFVKNLERDGTTFASYQREVKDHMTRMRLLRRELKTKTLVSDEEIGDYYVKNRQEYEGREAVRIKQILLLLPGDANDPATAKLKSEAETIRKRLMDGESFDLLAAQFSQGPSAATGGDVGFLEKGMILPEVDAVAFRMNMDEISEVIASSVGFHIIKVLDKRGAGIKPIDVVREEIKAKLEDEKMGKKYEEWIEELRKKSHIENKL